MAMMETKIIQVKNEPQIINSVNEIWGRWGWSVLSIQVTHSQDSKTYYEGGGEYYIQNVETTTINYATITYQRDRHMPHYDRIVELEQEYDSVDARVAERFAVRREAINNSYVEKPDIVRFKFGIGQILTILYLSALYLVPGIIYIVYKCYQYKKYKSPENQELIRLEAQHQQEKEAYSKKLYELRQEEENMVEEEKRRIIREAAELLKAA